MENRVFNRTWIEGGRLPIDDLREFAFQGESGADTFIISGKTAAGAAVPITGTITGNFLGGNNVSVPLVGEIQNGSAVITLDAACYAMTSRFILSIYAKNDDQILCIYCGIGYMFRTESERLAYPTQAIPDIQSLINEAQEIIGYVEEARTGAVAEIESAGADQTAAVEAKGAEVLESIPEDYSELSDDVETIKSDYVKASDLPSIAKGTGTDAVIENTISGTSMNVASGAAAHAEGKGTKAVGAYSHAEGEDTTATGTRSHAEGRGTSTLGFAAHSEGDNTFAKGQCSHAEGYNTTATHHSQHVFGRYNALDPSEHVASQIGTYAEIVGNGTSDNARSNARTLDWSGNEELAGDLTINKNGQNEMTVGQELSDLKSALSGNAIPVGGFYIKNIAPEDFIINTGRRVVTKNANYIKIERVEGEPSESNYKTICLTGTPRYENSTASSFNPTIADVLPIEYVQSNRQMELRLYTFISEILLSENSDDITLGLVFVSVENGTVTKTGITTATNTISNNVRSIYSNTIITIPDGTTHFALILTSRGNNVVSNNILEISIADQALALALSI